MMKSITLLLNITLLCCCLGGCVGLISPSQPARCPTTSPLWEAQVLDVIAALEVDAQRQLYLRTNDSLIALSQKDGILLWQNVVDFKNTAANIAATTDFVAVGTRDEILVFAAHTGEKLWQYRPDFSLARYRPYSLVADTTTLYVGFLFDKVMAFDLASGVVLWETSKPQQEHRAPNLVLNGQQIIVVKPERVYALDALTGDLEWQRAFEDMIYRPTLLSTEQVLVNGNRAMYSLSTTDGQIVWQSTAQVSQGAQGDIPAVATGEIVIGTNATGQLIAFESPTGKIIWQTDTDADILYAPMSIATEMLWVRTSLPARLQGYDLRTGERQFNMPLGNSWRQMVNPGIGPVIAGNQAFLANANWVFACPVIVP